MRPRFSSKGKSTCAYLARWGAMEGIAILLVICAMGQQTVADWQREAVREYPELGQKESGLNRLFVSEYSRLSNENAAFLSDPQWPMILVRECAEKLNKGKAGASGTARLASAQVPPATTGTEAGKTISYISDGPERVGYHVYYPKSFDPVRPPAILIMFSPQGKGEAILGNVKDACEAVGWIGVGCDEFKNKGNESELDMKWREILPHIEKTVPHDKGMMFLGGMSGGTLRAYTYIESTARPWKGVLAFGGWLGGKTRLDCPEGMVVARVNGENDRGAVSWEKADGAALEAAHCQVKTFHFPGGHEVAPPPVVLEAMQWLKAVTAREAALRTATGSGSGP